LKCATFVFSIGYARDLTIDPRPAGFEIVRIVCNTIKNLWEASVVPGPYAVSICSALREKQESDGVCGEIKKNLRGLEKLIIIFLVFDNSDILRCFLYYCVV
jgi:hypothetical protein